MFNTVRQSIYSMCAATGKTVYDYWIVNPTSFPYIITSTADAYDTYYKNTDRTDFSFEIHIFDKKRGKKTVVDIIESLETQFASLDGYGKSFNATVFEDKEPSIVHGIVTVGFKKYV